MDYRLKFLCQRRGLAQVAQFVRAAVLNLFGTGDQFRGRRMGAGRTGGRVPVNFASGPVPNRLQTGMGPLPGWGIGNPCFIHL